jgi:hypothetical protein
MKRHSTLLWTLVIATACTGGDAKPDADARTCDTVRATVKLVGTAGTDTAALDEALERAVRAAKNAEDRAVRSAADELERVRDQAPDDAMSQFGALNRLFKTCEDHPS